MLSYSDRHRFEEIRSRWEAAQILSDSNQSHMVGRKEKSAVVDSDDTTNASKFRRKLSHGLSFISLTQRRTTPVRPLLPQNNLATAVDVPDPQPHKSTRLLSPMQALPVRSSPVVQKLASSNNVSLQRSGDPDTTPKQLPRSRTMSFIPRPSRSESRSYGIDTDQSSTAYAPTFTVEDEARATPSKIPSPELTTQIRRKLSPRQYQKALTAQQEKHVAAGNAFARSQVQSLSKPSPVRSYTTPNLVAKESNPSYSVHFMSPRRSQQQRITGIPQPHKPNVKENSMPTTQRHVKRLSNIQEHSPSSPRREKSRRESVMAPTVASKRRSTGPVNVQAPRKQGVCATPPVSSKRKASQAPSQTPLSDQRAIPKKRSPIKNTNSLSASNGNVVTQSRLLGPVSPLTSVARGTASTHTSLPRATTEKDLRKRTFSTPYRKKTGTMLARGLAGMNNEVRLPRSSTYHHFADINDDIPPVPPIPEKYKSISMPLFPASDDAKGSVLVPKFQEPDSKEMDLNSGSLLSSDSYLVVSPVMVDTTQRQKSNFIDGIRQSRKSLLPKSKSKLSIEVPGSGRTLSTTALLSAKSSGSWSEKTPKSLDIADISVDSQVKDYMPALYWAGRFQSKFDHWRTEAMQVELDPEFNIEGPLAHYSIRQEKEAVCCIFLQLRDLCFSHQASDSLWVSRNSLESR